MKNYWLLEKPRIALSVNGTMIVSYYAFPQPLEKNNVWHFDDIQAICSNRQGSLIIVEYHIWRGAKNLLTGSCHIVLEKGNTLTLRIPDELYDKLTKS